MLGCLDDHGAPRSGELRSGVGARGCEPSGYDGGAARADLRRGARWRARWSSSWPFVVLRSFFGRVPRPRRRTAYAGAPEGFPPHPRSTENRGFSGIAARRGSVGNESAEGAAVLGQPGVQPVDPGRHVQPAEESRRGPRQVEMRPQSNASAAVALDRDSALEHPPPAFRASTLLDVRQESLRHLVPERHERQLITNVQSCDDTRRESTEPSATGKEQHGSGEAGHRGPALGPAPQDLGGRRAHACCTRRRYGSGCSHPSGKRLSATSSETAGEMIAWSPGCQFAGVASCCAADELQRVEQP